MDFLDLIDNNDCHNYGGLTKELKCILTYKRFIESNKSLLFLTSTLYDANIYYQILSKYTDKCLLFPMDDFLTSEALAVSPELKTNRLETLKNLSDGNKIIVTNLMGFLRYLPTKEIYNNSCLKIDKESEYNINELLSKLIGIGYNRTSIVNKTGDIAVRGYIIDIFPIGYDNPVRIEFWGDNVDDIRLFNVNTQLALQSIDEIMVYPNSEFIVENTQKEIDDTSQRFLGNYYCPGNILSFLDCKYLIIDEYDNLINNYNLLYEDINDYIKNNDLDPKTKFMHELKFDSNEELIFLTQFDILKEKDTINYHASELEYLSGSKEKINLVLNSYLKNKNKVIICLDNRYKINKLIDELCNDNVIYTDINNIDEKKINVINKKISYGFKINNVVVYSEREIFNKKENQAVYHTNFKYGQKIRDLNKLSVGDYVVHNTHGVGRYMGIKTLEKNGMNKDYLQIEYKDGDKLYIPVEKIELISKYSSNDSGVPKLNKLGGTEWQKTKIRVRKNIENIAMDLLKLYAERESTIGFQFKKDDEMQLEFEKQFIYNETKDQIKVIDEIKKDMESKVPMDRLLCGDVGYGKTEVAFRAIFKAILSNKQAAILCPTTLLSLQHYNSALERFKDFPVRIELLNRFVTPKKQKEIIKDLKENKIDLLIGTHRILSDDIKFHDLGLLVIDEEQRFGVKHKEKIKEYKSNIDILTLSATPIPRTLQMSLAGIRSLSLIETPPNDRYPIQTYVLAENKQVIKDAIYKEMARNGQVFILFNDIKNMEAKYNEIKSLVKEARIVSVHGKMSKNEIETIMNDFQNGEYDILLCTTIIETGIDIPTVNTLIIIDADHFGLSQLYQIRGRVGRSNKIAYCYLMYDKGKVLSDIAVKRLNVIKEFTELGSGFAIATRDLSIRGAGDILGSEQAGFIDTVGIELFLKMLNEEIAKIKGEKIEDESDEVDNPLVDVATSISDNYVKEEDLKIEIHKKINNIKNIDDLEKIKEEISDRFGKIDEDIIVYMHEELFDYKARNIGIKKIIQTKNFITIYLPVEISNNVDGDKLFMAAMDISRKIRFGMKNKELTITLDLVNLDKHFIYYLNDIVDIIKKSYKEV